MGSDNQEPKETISNQDLGMENYPFQSRDGSLKINNHYCHYVCQACTDRLF